MSLGSCAPRHPESVVRLVGKCGCVVYRCFVCQAGVKLQCGKCGGGRVLIGKGIHRK